MNDRRDEELRNAGTFAALFGLGILGMGLLLLVGLVFPQALFIVVLLILVPLFFGLHYLLWGSWLSVPREDDEEA